MIVQVYAIIPLEMHGVGHLTTKRFFEFARIFQLFIAYNNMPAFGDQFLIIQFDFKQFE